MKVEMFLENKVNRQLQMNGRLYTFERCTEDKYHQIFWDDAQGITIRAMYHEVNSYIKASESEDARVVKKTSPMLLCLYKDGERIQKDDRVTIGHRKYVVVQKINVQNFNVAYDISLEEIL